MSSMLTRRLAPSDSSREAKLLRSVCQPSFGLLIPACLIAGVTFLCQSVPGQSGCLPKWNSEAKTQSSEAVKSDSRFQPLSACSGIGRGRREESVLVAPTTPST